MVKRRLRVCPSRVLACPIFSSLIYNTEPMSTILPTCRSGTKRVQVRLGWAGCGSQVTLFGRKKKSQKVSSKDALGGTPARLRAANDI